MAYGDGFSVSNFKAILNDGLLKPTLYQCNFIPANKNGQETGFLGSKFSFFTDSINIPSVDLDTQMIRRYGYGPLEYVPFRPVFGPVSMSFMVEANQDNILYNILNAMSATSPFMGYNTMDSNVPVFGAGGGNNPYEVAYKDNIMFNLEVYIYNEVGNKIVTVTLNECFVKQIGSINLAWNSTDQYLRADVTFLATNYSIKTQDAPSDGNQIASDKNNPQLTGPDGAPTSVQDAINQNTGLIGELPPYTPLNVSTVLA
jgi:hypothetical protein